MANVCRSVIVSWIVHASVSVQANLSIMESDVKRGRGAAVKRVIAQFVPSLF